MPQCKSLRQVSYSTRPAASMRIPWPQCRPHCKNASCAPSLLGACWRTVTPKTCWATSTAASRWTPVSASKPTTALVPPPRTHRHRYFGVLAPNSPLREAVTALAQPAAAQPATVETAQSGAGVGVPGVAAPGNAATPTPEPAAPPKRPAHYLWAVLIARIYEVFPLLCPNCGGQMRIIAFITHSAEIRHILNHIGVDSQPPHITPARGPPLWEDCDAPVDDGVQGEPDWDLAAQPAPDYEVDQRVNW